AGGGRHGYAVRCRRRRIIVRARPAGDAPSTGGGCGQLNRFSGDVLACCTTGRVAGSGRRIGTLATVRASERITRWRSLCVSDAYSASGGRHRERIGGGGARVVVRAGPAADLPARGGRRRQLNRFSGNILAAAAAGRIRWRRRGIAALP